MSDVKGKKKAAKYDEDCALCHKFIERNMAELLRSKRGRKSLLGLSEGPILELLKSDSLVIRSELELIILVAAWVNYQIENEGKIPVRERKSSSSDTTVEAEEPKKEDVPGLGQGISRL